MKRFSTYLTVLLAFVVAVSPATAQEVHRLINGHWYNGSTFVASEFFVVNGVLQSDHSGEAQTVDLQGAYVVPGYGNAHTHGIGNNDFDTESNNLLGRGVFYVANPNSIGSRSAEAREMAASPLNVDALFANGGLTSSGGHPSQIFERYPDSKAMDGDAYFSIDSMDDLEQRWPEVLGGNPDFIKVYLERSEFHEKRKHDLAYYGKRGLDPKLIAPIVEKAHAAGLRVAAHVTSRHDVDVALKAGVDELAHLPLEKLKPEDAKRAAKNGTTIVTTTLSHRPSDGVHDLDALHKSNLKLLLEAGAHVVLGTDSHATVVDEVLEIASLDVFPEEALLRTLVVDTPRWLFPNRDLGSLKSGARADFVALESNPLEDLRALKSITHVYKGGHPVELQTASEDEKEGIGQHLVHTIMSKGVDAAIEEYQRLRNEESEEWDFSEGQLNALGYAMMQHGKLTEATKIFQLNCDQYPESANVWDSLAESYMERGENEAAIKHYEKSLDLNPDNENALAKLRLLRKR
ncbi:MAG: amidohydrolase family protein [Candidatus Eisenbacteria bacterium]|uniref:Amidohydrolase family protein n=1 Tax=Eiseniibacteriota bacterium TaxID=2212470 RepID=A0A7Y2H1V4_UNCEI|nr:amidohydrolase family protein [Candidatus Eisenbacteria bacterium]